MVLLHLIIYSSIVPGRSPNSELFWSNWSHLSSIVDTFTHRLSTWLLDSGTSTSSVDDPLTFRQWSNWREREGLVCPELCKRGNDVQRKRWFSGLPNPCNWPSFANSRRCDRMKFAMLAFESIYIFCDRDSYTANISRLICIYNFKPILTESQVVL